MSDGSRIMQGIRRGLALRCPNCGEGHLFARFLKVRERCEVCGENNRVFPSDDAPPYLTLLLVGHVIFPFMFWMDKAWSPDLWIMFALWLPLITVMTVALLPFMKGMVIGIAWANGITRETARQ